MAVVDGFGLMVTGSLSDATFPFELLDLVHPELHLLVNWVNLFVSSFDHQQVVCDSYLLIYVFLLTLLGRLVLFDDSFVVFKFE